MRAVVRCVCVGLILVGCGDGERIGIEGFGVEFDIVGSVRSGPSGAPIAGATVTFGHGQVDSERGTAAVTQVIDTFVTDDEGRFRVRTVLRCGDEGWVLRVDHPDYFVHYPGISRFAAVECTGATQEVSITLAPRAVAVEFDVDTVAVGDTVHIGTTFTFADGSESDWLIHMLWAPPSPADVCGRLLDRTDPDPAYVAPERVPEAGECGQARGEVHIDLSTYQDMKGLVRAVSGTAVLTIVDDR